MIYYFLLGFLSIPFFYYFFQNSKYKKIFEILKNDPFLLFRIARDNFKYYYNKNKTQNISELKVGEKYYELDYTFNGVNYTKRFHKIFKPSTLNIIKIYTISGENGVSFETDLTDKLRPYIGVNKDFHSATPSLLGYENLHFVTEDILEETTDIIKIEKNTPIKL